MLVALVSVLDHLLRYVDSQQLSGKSKQAKKVVYDPSIWVTLYLEYLTLSERERYT